jgi:outer membrane protein
MLRSLCARGAGILALIVPAAALGVDPPAPVAATTVVPPPTVKPAAGPLSLDEAVKLVLTKNERATISDLNVVVAVAAVEKARTAFLPLLTAQGQDTAHGTAVPTNVGTGNVILLQPLINASAFPLYAQARRLEDAQRQQNVDDRRLLEFSAATAFFAVLSAQDVVVAAQRQLENARANLSDTTARAEAGLSSTNDVTRANLDAQAAARELETDKGALDNAYVQLALAVNTPVPSSVVPPSATLLAAKQPAGAPDSLVQVAMERRPDLNVAKLQAVAAHDFADEPMLRLIPTLAVQGQLTANSNVPTSAGGHWNDEIVQGTLIWTPYDSGVRYADKHSRDALAAIADLDVTFLARNVDAQVRSAVAVLLASQSAFSVADEAVKLARQSVDETAILYREGLAKAIELVDANDSRFAAEVNYASAEYAMAQAYLDLRQAIGLHPLGTDMR